MAETLKLLVTDDELGMRMAVSRALKDFAVRLPEVGAEVRVEVEQAASGEEALDKIAASAPQILLLDHKLPGLSGLEVLERIKGRDDLLTIMITAYASLETAVTATKRGAFDFLAKPFTPEELKAVVYKAVNSLMLSRQAKRLAQEKRQVRLQFVRVLAHELQAPIAAVEGYLQILRGDASQDPKNVEHMLDRCMVRIGQMRKLIGDLLDLTRIESGVKKRELTDLDLNEVALSAIETAKPVAQERGISIALKAEGPLRITADRGELEMILNNLLSNAVKYNRENGQVELALATEPGRATIRVSDTGIGMTPEEAAKLFNDFVRIRNDKTRSIFGSGLGLSTVRRLAQLYDGEVRVESQPDEGSTFTVILKTPPAQGRTA